MLTHQDSPLHVLLCGFSTEVEAHVRRALEGYALEPVQGADAIAMALSERPHAGVLVFDPSEPGPAWVFETARGLRVDAALVVVGADGGEEAAVRAVKSGAGGFVSLRSIEKLREVLAREIADASTRIARKEEVRKARATEAFLHAVMDNVADGIVIWGEDGRVVAMNRAAERLFGRRADELVGRGRHALLGAGLEGARALTRELSGRRPDGSHFVGEASFGAMFEGSRRYEIVAVRDVTARRRLERSLAAAQRFESLGALAGTLAHDLNNALSAVLAYAEIIAPEGESPQLREDIEGLRASTRMASGLMRQLLSFARRQQLSPRKVSLRASIDQSVQALRPLLGASVLVRVRVDDDTPAARVDPEELQRVLMNLCVNARDAMPDGGTIELRAMRAKIDPPSDERWLGVPPGLYAEVQVRDTGTGVDPSVAERIFEPFVTSKPTGKGTGLGLAAVRGAIEQHGGMVEFEANADGPGTTFRFLLPAVVERESEATEGAVARPRVSVVETSPRALVLVAVGQPSVRRLLARELTAAGFAVRVAVDRDEVARALEGDARGAALLLIDEPLLGEGATAREALLSVRARAPQAPVLLMCDRDEDVGNEARGAVFDLDDAIDARPVVRVSRHFAYGDLEAQVRALLDEA